MVKHRLILLTVLLASILSLGLLPSLTQDSGVLNIYSSRHYGAMEAPFVEFTNATGIEVRVSAGSPRDLLARLRADLERGDRSVADLFLAIDAGVLSLAAEEGLLIPVESDILTANIPQSQRDPEGRWFGLSQRARTLVYNPENVTEDELTNLNNYADLADPVWEGRICMRPAAHIYTVSLFSSLVYHLGEEAATEAAQGIADNVTRYIDSDTRQIEAVAAGECDVALVNHYYLGFLANGDEAAQATFNAIAIKWMNQGEEGTGNFYNVNGAGVVKNAANYDNAVKFIEFMSTPEMQCGKPQCFVGSNYEYPVNPEVAPNETIAGFGEFELDLEYSLWEYGNYQEATIAILEEVGFGFEEN